MRKYLFSKIHISAKTKIASQDYILKKVFLSRESTNMKCEPVPRGYLIMVLGSEQEIF